MAEIFGTLLNMLIFVGWKLFLFFVSIAFYIGTYNQGFDLTYFMNKSVNLFSLSYIIFFVLDLAMNIVSKIKKEFYENN